MLSINMFTTMSCREVRTISESILCEISKILYNTHFNGYFITDLHKSQRRGPDNLSRNDKLPVPDVPFVRRFYYNAKPQNMAQLIRLLRFVCN